MLIIIYQGIMLIRIEYVSIFCRRNRALDAFFGGSRAEAFDVFVATFPSCEIKKLLTNSNSIYET